MTRRAWDRDAFYNLEGPTEVDLNRVTGEGAHAGLRELLRVTSLPIVGVDSPTTQQIMGFYGDSFLVLPENPASGNVIISAGTAVRRDDSDQPANIGGIDGLDENSTVKPVVYKDPKVVATPAPPAAPNNRIDIIEVRIARQLVDLLPVKTLGLPSGSASFPAKNKTLTYALDPLAIEYVPTAGTASQPIAYKVGADALVPVAPPVDAGYVKICEIYKANSVSWPAGTVTQRFISDYRRMLFLGGTANLMVKFQFPLAAGPPVITAAHIPPGIRLAVARTNPANTDYSVYVLNNVDASFMNQSPLIGGVLTSFDLARLELNTFSALAGGDVTIINDPTLTFPAQEVTVGAPARWCSAQTFMWDGVAKDFVASTSDPQRSVVLATLS